MALAGPTARFAKVECVVALETRALMAQCDWHTLIVERAIWRHDIGAHVRDPAVDALKDKVPTARDGLSWLSMALLSTMSSVVAPIAAPLPLPLPLPLPKVMVRSMAPLENRRVGADARVAGRARVGGRTCDVSLPSR